MTIKAKFICTDDYQSVSDDYIKTNLLCIGELQTLIQDFNWKCKFFISKDSLLSFSDTALLESVEVLINGIVFTVDISIVNKTNLKEFYIVLSRDVYYHIDNYFKEFFYEKVT